MSANDQQSPSAAPPAQQQPPVPSTTQPASTASETLACQWQGCGERCPSAELLYDHVCERHVGRKSTNNLNLTCQWGTCRTTTVKRDHITSHIRVHVPLKPHKCEFCGKAFKRPQDLKKHVKTHADDSVILRSPEPAGGARPAQGNMYNVSNGKAPGYYDAPVTGGGYSHPNPTYYQPQHPQQHNSSYGNVYYATMPTADIGNQASYEARKRGYEALDQFFADLKRRNFDSASYAAVAQRLMQLQGLQLPDVIVPSYQPAPAMVAAGGHGGHGAPIPPAPAPYVLPPMPHLRTKNDLTSIDQFLEQMQATVYENDNQVAAAGVAQPGAQYIPSMHYRSSHSPPGVQLPSAHQTTANASIISHGSSHSPHSQTPALTPPSSAQSYTSGHSPASLPSHHYSPQQQTSGGMYPTLPATTAHENVESSYGTSAAPTSTLGSMFDNDPRRRYSGGMLQRAAPAPGEPVDSAMSDTSATPPAKSPTVRKTSRDMAIDPALGGSIASPTAVSESGKSEEKATNADRAEEEWVENIRVIEALRKYLRERLEKKEYIGDDGIAVEAEGEGRDRMEGVEQERRRDEAPLYPVLRA